VQRGDYEIPLIANSQSGEYYPFSVEALDLIDQMLQSNLSDRITIEDIAKHPYCSTDEVTNLNLLLKRRDKWLFSTKIRDLD